MEFIHVHIAAIPCLTRRPNTILAVDGRVFGGVTEKAPLRTSLNSMGDWNVNVDNVNRIWDMSSPMDLDKARPAKN